MIEGAEPPHTEEASAYDNPAAEDPKRNGNVEYLALSDQFVVPVVKDGKISSMVLLTLALEIQPGRQEDVMKREPLMRGALLQAMFDHANIGGFDGSFTNSNKLDKLRRSFREVVITIFDDEVSDVLIVEMTRQDLS